MGISAKVYDRTDLVTPVATVTTNIVGAGWTEEQNEPGYGEVRLPYDHANLSAFTPTRLVVLGEGGTDRFVFEIRNRQVDRMQRREEAGQIWTISGDGAALALGTSNVGGAVVLPSCGDVDAFQSDLRMFGWMDCCCFDHSGWPAVTTLGRQDNPDPPWSPTSPGDWPDGRAQRIWCSAPSQTVAGTDEVQSIALGTSIDSGTFTLTFRGQTTSAIGTPWSAAQVDSALEALSTVGAGNVTVTGTGLNSDPYIVTFVNDLGDQNVPMIDVNHGSLDHPPQTATVTEVTRGAPGTYATAAGCCYFYQTFATATDMDLILFYNMKRTGTIFIDGVEVARQTTGAAAKSTQTVPVSLEAGTHCITAKVCKSGASGVAWFMATLAEAVDNGDGSYTLGQVATRTGSGWQGESAAIGADEPGMTVGAIMECLMDEAQALQSGTSNVPDLFGVTWGFDPTDDSDSVAWDREYVWGVRVGTGLLDVLQQLADLDGFTWRMQHSPLLQLDIWQDRGSDLSGSVIFTEASQAGGILETLPTGRAPIATSLLVETQSGAVLASQQAGLDAYGSRRIGVAIGTAPTYEGLSGFAGRTFLRHAREVWDEPLRTWGPAGLRPYADFDIDDVISAANRSGNAEDFRAVGFTIALDDSGSDEVLFAIALQDLP